MPNEVYNTSQESTARHERLNALHLKNSDSAKLVVAIISSVNDADPYHEDETKG
jgi:hypothetical protein